MNFANVSFKNAGYTWTAGTVLACLLIVYGFYSLILTPQLDQKMELTNQLQMEKARVATIEQFADNHPNREEYLRSLDAEVVRVSNLLPDKANLGETISFIESTAKNTHVVFGALTTEKGAYKNGWSESRLAFKVLGGYNDLLEFTRQLDSGPRFMAVRAVEFHDRIILSQMKWKQSDIEKMVEKELSTKSTMLVRPIIERGLLSKQNLVIMNVYLMVASNGRLPDIEGGTSTTASAPPQQAAQPAASNQQTPAAQPANSTSPTPPTKK